jgi:hypothetical protein
MKHTKEQIQEQIDRLHDMKLMLPEKNGTGGSNWDEVDAMINTLKVAKETDAEVFKKLKKDQTKGNTPAVELAEDWLAGRYKENLAELYELSRSGAHLPDEAKDADDRAIAKFDETDKEA